MPSVRRSEELWVVALYLANHGVGVNGGPSLPPATTGTARWLDAYRMFYAALGAGRPEKQFRASLKNARDNFDSHVASGRIGWRFGNRAPQALPSLAARVFRIWSGRTEAEMWAEVVRHAAMAPVVPTAAESEAFRRVDASIDSLTNDVNNARTEGRIAVRAIAGRERDGSLRAAALRIHGFACMACGFDFRQRYGVWGEGFAHVHHSVPLSQGPAVRVTDPRTDLMVLCPNCHAMMHAHPPTVLSLDELRAKIIP